MNAVQSTWHNYTLRIRISSRDKLLKTSDLLCDQIRSIDKNRLLPDKLTALTEKEMLLVELQTQILLDFNS